MQLMNDFVVFFFFVKLSIDKTLFVMWTQKNES